jgi:hypothetical protein
MPVSDAKDGHSPEVTSSNGPEKLPRLVDQLRHLAATEGEITVGDLVDSFGAQGHAPLLMIVAVLMILPVGMIPGIGGALGLAVAAIGAQMILGRTGVWLPGFMRRRSISAEHVGAIADAIRPVSLWLSRHLYERLEWLAVGRWSLTVVALLMIVAGGSLVILGALPIAVPLIGLPIAIFAIGIMAADGIVMVTGYILLLVIAGGLVSVW